MRKLLIIFALLLPFWLTAQIRPDVNADLLDWFDSEYFLDTTDFAVTKVWYVDVNYSGDQQSNGTLFAPFTAIQQAFDSCSVGDIVLVYPGTYPAEHLHPIIDSIKLLSLSGPSQTFVALTASGGTGFDMDSEGMTIDGFYFTGDAGFLIQLEGGEDGFTLKNCVIDTEGTPSIGLNIGASGCSNMTVENNKFISETDDGAIWLQKNVSNSLIRNNWFVGADSSVSYAIQSAGSTGGRYIGNLIEGYASGIFLHTVTAGSGGTANELIANNIIRNCGNAIRLGHSSQTVDMDSMFVFSNTLYYNSFAIFIADDANVLSGTFEITGNIIADNTVAIRNAGTVPTYLANLIDDHYVATSAPVIGDDLTNKTYVDALVTAQDLDFAGDAGTGSVDLDSETFTLAGTANEIETSAGSQTITIGLPDAVTINTLTLTNQSTEATYDIINNSELQNSLVGSYYNFTIDDYIEVADNDNLDFGTGDFSQTIRFYLNTVSGTQYLVNKEAGGIGYGIYITDDDIYIRFDDNNADASGIILTAKIVVDTWYILSIAFDRDGNASANLNGTITGTVDISGTNLTLSNTGNYRLGSTTAGADFFDGYIDFNLLWNRAITTTEMNEVSRWSSDNPPVWFSDVGASQTPTYTSDFSVGVDGWNATRITATGNIDGISDGATSKDDVLRLVTVASSGDKYIRQNILTATGKKYRVNITYLILSANDNVDGFIVFDDDAANTLYDARSTSSMPAIIGTWTTLTFEYDSPASGFRLILFDGVTSSPDWGTNNIVYVSVWDATQIGVVANYNGSGIGHNTWMDASGNDLYGTVSGATYTNIPNSDTEEARQDGITTDTQILSSSNLVPDGYVLKYVIGTEVAGNTATLDLGTSAGGSQVFSQQVFTASTATPVAVDFFNLTGSDIALYINDDGAGTWNSGELDFIFVIQKIR